ncbi:uncharacterized protein RHOBADRAFT_52037 [Rhodotorula graminis WP1]|uniref:CUE domain-containing protein n=1 Tax=Rhodotorula graminis (strain WP1) TaxID=578459 RepID=A0A194S907_RHOGW|nr:uncharacterized protein RHOBADRAFT_52037 [Rhodotorula graminis WP1]KPV77082.1 hypothetical protein RHOBADRAFT_52037 [Rhodotorula graminis WP1]
MSATSLAGAPLSRALILTSAVASVAAAITNSQHWFHLALSPHLSRDHQLYRLVAHPLVYASSAELFLGTLVLWQTSIAVERILGTRKYASFLAVTTFLSIMGTFAALVAASVVTRGRFNVLPSGPFAVTFAILHQSHRLTPTLYTFRLLHPSLVLPTRFPAYLLSLLLALSQPPSTLVLALIGLCASSAWSHNALGLAHYRIPRRVYRALSRLSPADGARARIARGTEVEHDEAMLRTLAGGGGGGGVTGFASAAGGGVDVGGLRGRRPGAVTQAVAPATAAPAVTSVAPPASAAEPSDDAVAAAAANAAAPAPPPSARPLPSISGTSFLRQWQAGLTGAPDGPTPAQIAELSSIFPHHSRQAIVAALQSSGQSVSRAAELLVSEGG